MAYFDSETGCLNLQVVYDGAPFSGKTSSVVSLGRLLGREVVISEQHNERTAYFDWLELAGGDCHGRPIKNRVVSVPGQQELEHRRDVILSGADAIVLVVDSSAQAFAQTVEHFESLKAKLAGRSSHVPILLQLNKRDAEDALPRDEVTALLDPSLPVVETVATTGNGVREALVLVVGEAVRELRASSRLYDSTDLFETQGVRLPSPEMLREILDSL